MSDTFQADETPKDEAPEGAQEAQSHWGGKKWKKGLSAQAADGAGEPENDPDPVAGDVVKLNSGGPPMTVSSVVASPTGDVAKVAWFTSDDRPVFSEFPVACITLAS